MQGCLCQERNEPSHLGNMFVNLRRSLFLHVKSQFADAQFNNLALYFRHNTQFDFL
jgi:hypothetical protein